MAHLLNDIGLLSSHAKNQHASLQAIDEIISTAENSIKNNTLVENRVWINCFSDDDARDKARNVWSSLRENAIT